MDGSGMAGAVMIDIDAELSCWRQLEGSATSEFVFLFHEWEPAIRVGIHAYLAYPDRDFDSLADLSQDFQAALKVLLIGQDAEARCAVRLIDSGDGHGIKVRADDAFTGAGLLDFGNELDWAGGSERRKKVSYGRCVG